MTTLADIIDRVDNILGDQPDWDHWDDTANGSKKVFKLDKHIVKNSEIVQVGGETKTRVTDYAIYDSPGRIAFVTTPDGSPQPAIDIEANWTKFSWLAKRQGINDALSQCYWIERYTDAAFLTAADTYEYTLPTGTEEIWKVEIAIDADATQYLPWRLPYELDSINAPTKIIFGRLPDYPRKIKLWRSKAFAALTNPTDALDTNFPNKEVALNYLAICGAAEAIKAKVNERHIFDTMPISSENEMTDAQDMRARLNQLIGRGGEIEQALKKARKWVLPTVTTYTQVG